MERQLSPEWLDQLPPDDPHARRSRRDLRRINAIMSNARWLARLLAAAPEATTPDAIVDVGAGDGAFLRQVARRLNGRLGAAEVVLVDQQNAVAPEVLPDLHALGLRPRFEQADVFAWLANAPISGHVWIVANLFLHHFEAETLRGLLRLTAARAALFCACEPRRSQVALAGSRLLWALGANRVTRHDAVASVRAGFSGQELSALWPSDGAWSLREGRAGLFTHAFLAVRRAPGADTQPHQVARPVGGDSLA